jgi:fructose-1-phosphate kinase PfkB-like protein
LGIENVMISLGAKGASLTCDEGAFFAEAPKIEPISTIGAGDSSIAGFLMGLSLGESYEDCLRRAVAFGTAACLTSGTRPPRASDVERFLVL